MIAASVLLLSAASSNATQLVGNLPQTNDGGSGVVSIETIRGVTFTTSSSDFEVTSVTLRLENYLSATDVAFLTLRTGTTSAPSTVVGSFSAPPSTSSGFNDYTFLPTATIQLQANTLYWLVITADSNTETFDWSRSNPVKPPTGIGTFGFQQISYNAGASWDAGESGPHSFSIDGNTVPEPGIVILFAAGIAVVLTAFRHRRRAAL